MREANAFVNTTVKIKMDSLVPTIIRTHGEKLTLAHAGALHNGSNGRLLLQIRIAENIWTHNQVRKWEGEGGGWAIFVGDGRAGAGGRGLSLLLDDGVLWGSRRHISSPAECLEHASCNTYSWI
eukprot:1195633-Prorocentrum_minimum.AAC.4